MQSEIGRLSPFLQKEWKSKEGIWEKTERKKMNEMLKTEKEKERKKRMHIEPKSYPIQNFDSRKKPNLQMINKRLAKKETPMQSKGEEASWLELFEMGGRRGKKGKLGV